MKDPPDRETNILKYLYRAEGKSVAREELLSEVWGYHAAVTTHIWKRISIVCGKKLNLIPQMHVSC